MEDLWCLETKQGAELNDLTSSLKGVKEKMWLGSKVKQIATVLSFYILLKKLVTVSVCRSVLFLLQDVVVERGRRGEGGWGINKCLQAVLREIEMTAKHKDQNNKTIPLKTRLISTPGLRVCTKSAGWVCNASEGTAVVLHGWGLTIYRLGLTTEWGGVFEVIYIHNIY